MQSASLCFSKVKNDCLRFITSQETSTDKFKNKEKMIKSFLIPICFWIAKKANKQKPYFIGLAGGQGTGKTTISSIIKIILEKYFKTFGPFKSRIRIRSALVQLKMSSFQNSPPLLNTESMRSSKSGPCSL